MAMGSSLFDSVDDGVASRILFFVGFIPAYLCQLYAVNKRFAGLCDSISWPEVNNSRAAEVERVFACDESADVDVRITAAGCSVRQPLAMDKPSLFKPSLLPALLARLGRRRALRPVRSLEMYVDPHCPVAVEEARWLARVLSARAGRQLVRAELRIASLDKKQQGEAEGAVIGALVMGGAPLKELNGGHVTPAFLQAASRAKSLERLSFKSLDTCGFKDDYVEDGVRSLGQLQRLQRLEAGFTCWGPGLLGAAAAAVSRMASLSELFLDVDILSSTPIAHVLEEAAALVRETLRRRSRILLAWKSRGPFNAALTRALADARPERVDLHWSLRSASDAKAACSACIPLRSLTAAWGFGCVLRTQLPPPHVSVRLQLARNASQNVCNAARAAFDRLLRRGCNLEHAVQLL